MKAHRRVFARKACLAVVGALVLAVLLIGPVHAAELSEQEQTDLLFIREEEKLARDVYQVLSASWGGRIFTNIARSEQNHMDAVKILLDRYALDDPASSVPGVFTNQDLQALYNQLVGAGSASYVEALKVDIFIEKTDIGDLEAAMANTEQFDIRTVYSNLSDGSRNHLDAFTSALAKRVAP